MSWLETAAERAPEAIALRGVTYAELLATARAIARGLERGARVPLRAEPTAAFLANLHACDIAGAVAVPIDPRLSEAERAEREHAAADGPDPDPPGTLMIVFTSGTTRAPRPIALTRANVEANARGVNAALGLTASDRWLAPMPLAHVGGLMVVWRCAIAGATAQLATYETAATRDLLLDPVAGITVVSLVPTMLARLLDAGLSKPPTLRHAMLGGGPLDPALKQRARAAQVPVADSYGLTEACSTVAIGRPLPGVTVEIAADKEILVGGPTVAPSAQPRLHTGDLGVLDEDGHLTVIGRKADTIVTGAENVAPQEVEAVLREHPAIADAGVYGEPDPEWGEAIVARVVARPHVVERPSDEALRAFCRERLARFKVPKRFEWDGHLPRNAAGKLLRKNLGS